MLISPKELWNNGGYGKDNPFERSMEYVKKLGVSGGLSSEAIDAIIAEFFIELQEGRKYSTTSCSCGCGINKSGTDAVHELVKRIVSRKEELKDVEYALIEMQVNQAIIRYIETKNEEYIQENMKPRSGLLAWENSPTLKLLKKVKNGLVRNS